MRFLAEGVGMRIDLRNRRVALRVRRQAARTARKQRTLPQLRTLLLVALCHPSEVLLREVLREVQWGRSLRLEAGLEGSVARGGETTLPRLPLDRSQRRIAG